MATQSVFSGSVAARTAPSFFRFIGAASTKSGAALTAAELLNGLNIGAGAALTLPTAVSLAAEIPSVQVGDTFEFTCQTTDAVAVTLTASAGITITGLATTAAGAAGSAATFLIRCTTAPTATIGTGAAFVAFRK